MTFDEYLKKNKERDLPPIDDWEFDVSMLVTEARLYAGLTQMQLAKIMKTKQPSIARVESGKVLPSLDFLHKLAKAVGMELILPRFASSNKKESPSHPVWGVVSKKVA